MNSNPHPFVRLARESVHHFLRHGERMNCPPDLPETFQRPSGVFVTLRRKGQLRGCIGTLTPQTPNLAEEIIRNAVQAAFHDPRFPSVESSEMKELEFAIEVVTPPTPVDNLQAQDPKSHGLVVRNQKKQGVLLPGIEGVDTVEEQLRICRQKGQFQEGEPQEFFRFQVESYH